MPLGCRVVNTARTARRTEAFSSHATLHESTACAFRRAKFRVACEPLAPCIPARKAYAVAGRELVRECLAIDVSKARYYALPRRSMAPALPFLPPREGTAEHWALRYLTTSDFADKTCPPPADLAFEHATPARRVASPSRPPPLRVVDRSPKSPRPGALRDPRRRAQLFHTFWHHELQAAELMAWALLAFPESPVAFRRGLLRVASDEIRHMGLYSGLLAELGVGAGTLPVRDWFWARVPACEVPAQFVAVMGVGFEGGNLDHAVRFAETLRAVGDDCGARVQEHVCADEERHVRFALTWLREFAGDASFATWMRHLPAPLSPMLMRGAALNTSARQRAGLDDAFLRELREWRATPLGS